MLINNNSLKYFTGNYSIPNSQNNTHRTTYTLTSMEVADMVDKQHKNLMRDIRIYCVQIEEFNKELEEKGERKIELVDFFKESTYLDAKGEKRPCYDVTKKGCEFISNKLTGVKGTLFTARYINRFHDMEETILENSYNNYGQEENNKFMLVLTGINSLADCLHMNDAGKLTMYRKTFEEFNLPTKMIPDYENNGSREMCSVSALLERNNCGIKAISFNKMLVSSGILEERQRKSSKGEMKKFKALSEKGLMYGENLVSEKNPKEVQPYYYADSFMDLYKLVTK